MKFATSISKTEIKLYFALWISAVFYSVYQSYKVGNEFFTEEFEDVYNDFAPGWKWLHRKKDNTDVEWKWALTLYSELLPWYLVHTIVAELLRQYINNKQVLKIWYPLISLTYALCNLGLKGTFYLIYQPIVCLIAAQFKSKAIIWICNLCSLVVLNYNAHFIDVSQLNDFEAYITVAAIAWINLRCLNYFLEAMTDEKMRKINLRNVATVLSYCFYLPLLFHGPLIIFINFKNVFDNCDTRSFSQRIKELIIRLIRFSFWLFFIEFVLHFVYVNALSYQPQVINNTMGYWALYGLGYSMGQFFQTKYVVLYGISTSFAQFEGITVPSLPKCIGRIHLYSDMWKYFDRGLYIFLIRYIYIPLSGTKKTITRKLFASFVCFGYVYIWHGIQNFIAIWTLLNFLGIAIETVCNAISQTSTYQNKVLKPLGFRMSRRLTCFLAAPLFAMSALSNFYFFAGREVGDIYIYRFLQAPGLVTLTTWTVLYIGSHVSTEIKEWEDSRKNKEIPIK